MVPRRQRTALWLMETWLVALPLMMDIVHQISCDVEGSKLEVRCSYKIVSAMILFIFKIEI